MYHLCKILLWELLTKEVYAFPQCLMSQDTAGRLLDADYNADQGMADSSIVIPRLLHTLICLVKMYLALVLPLYL